MVKGPVSGKGSKAQRGEGINRFNIKHAISYPFQVPGFEAHHSTTEIAMPFGPKTNRLSSN
jgi:hypothetical protein